MDRIRTSVLGLSAAMLVGASAAWGSEPTTVPPASWQWEVGARYWYSTGDSTKDLFDTTGSILVSRLTYQDLDAHSGEAFFRGDHRRGFLVKGYVGSGAIGEGTLIDEDFSPVFTPYSNTTSDQSGGRMTLASIDVGYNFWQSPNASLGAIVGYHYWKETYHANGCRQNASSRICRTTVPTAVRVISQENEWHSLRLGVVGGY